MRILLAADQYPEFHNGAGAFTERLANGLVADGHDVSLAYPSVRGSAGATVRDGLRDHRLSSLPLPHARGLRFCTPGSALRQARALLARQPVDVVHVQSHLPVGRAFLAAAGDRGIPVVATNHFMPENLLPHVPVTPAIRSLIGAWAWRDLAQVFARADLVTTPTGRAAALLTEQAGLSDVQVISNGVDLELFRPGTVGQLDQPSAPDGASAPQLDVGAVPFVLFVGRLEEEKRVDDLLRAFAALPTRLPVRLVYIGRGSRLPALRHLAHEHRITDRVEFWGNVGAERLRRAYATCSVFCAPGVAELQSLVTLEAVASGAPVIAADAVALPHLVHHGRNGFRYPPDRPEQLTEHLVRLLTSPELRARMSAESREIAQAHDLSGTVEAYLDCYRRVTTQTPLVTTPRAAEPALAA